MGVIISWQNNAVANVLFLTERFWLVFAPLLQGANKDYAQNVQQDFVSEDTMYCISTLLC